MAARVATNFQRRMNSYVPALSYAVDVIENAPSRFSLGTPTLEDTDGILASTDVASAGSTATFLLSEMSGTYGRNLVIQKPTGSATGTVTVKGRDYLGQPMVETFAAVAATATIVQGVKAFKWVDEVSWTAMSGSTLHVGFGRFLGLPYVLEASIAAIEDGNRVLDRADIVWLPVNVNDTNTATTTTFQAISPIRGNIVATRAVVTTVIGGANEALTFNVNGGTAITGLALSLLTASSAVGNTFEKSVADATANCAVVPGDVINVVNDGASSSGAAVVYIGILPSSGLFIQPSFTDPQTATTRDPRGLYRPYVTLNGSREIEVVYTASRKVNSSGNGGLYGIRHFFS